MQRAVRVPNRWVSETRGSETSINKLQWSDRLASPQIWTVHNTVGLETRQDDAQVRQG
jgi:hypothetical protein